MSVAEQFAPDPAAGSPVPRPDEAREVWDRSGDGPLRDLRETNAPDAAANSGSRIRIPMAEAQHLVDDLVEPRPAIYWADYLASATLGWGGFVLALTLPAFSVAQILVAIVSTLALYRAVLFIHELAHRKPGSFRLFRSVWDLTCGFVFMVPSFLYAPVHVFHHSLKVYGRAGDGEYVPFASLTRWRILGFMGLIFLLPVLFPLRFVILTPLSMVIPKLRRLAWEGLSSLTIDFNYKRPPPNDQERLICRLEEAGAFVYGTIFAILFLTGVLSLEVFVLWYCVVVGIFFVNSLRTLAAHAYRNGDDEVMDWTQQFLDSIDIPGNRFWTPIWAPVGLRFHATHHLFPNMPYHSLGEAYRRLSSQLSTRDLYLEASRPSLSNALSRLWSEAGSRSAKQ